VIKIIGQFSPTVSNCFLRIQSNRKNKNVIKMKLCFLFIFTLFSFTTAFSQQASNPVPVSKINHPLPLSRQLAQTVMHTWKDSFALDGKPAKWAYEQGIILKGFEGIWMNTADAAYFDYIKKSMDFFVTDDGQIKTYKQGDLNIDNVNNGKILLLLYRVTGKAKYLSAARLLREQLQQQPRTNEGGFWNKKVYPYQMWLDGLYMGQPFYAEYAWLAKEDTAFNDIANQFIWMEKHVRDAKTGLLYHGWDESRQQKWANKTTGTSPDFWGRAMGWYAMALVDVLDYFPTNHPKRNELIGILNRLTKAIEKVQDKNSGMWWDILNMPGKKNNYLETSASSMFVYAIAKGVRKGYLPAQKISVAKNAYDGIVKKYIKVEDGQTNLYGTVKVSGLGGKPYGDGSYEYYVGEHVVVNDPKGVGAFLLASNEMEMLPTLNIGKGRTVVMDNFFNRETKKDAFGNTIITHYKWHEKDNGGFSFVQHAFNKYGVNTTLLDEAPTALNLKNASIYLLVDPDWPNENKNPNYILTPHINALTDWVKDGGILVMLANDSNNVEFKHFNDLAEKFGIQFNENLRNDVKNDHYEEGELRMPADHPIFKTAKKVYIKQLCTLNIEEPAKSVYSENGEVIMAVSKLGRGTVFAVGDPWFYNEYVDGRKLPAEYNNYGAVEDLVRWLIVQTTKK
jgi:unsaturated rhamnogalacturonyl hydrolase